MIKLKIDEVNVAHTKLRVFAGKRGSTLALCGSLVMRKGEYQELLSAIRFGDVVEPFNIVIEDKKNKRIR